MLNCNERVALPCYSLGLATQAGVDLSRVAGFFDTIK
jgi:hypothetical protein